LTIPLPSNRYVLISRSREEAPSTRHVTKAVTVILKDSLNKFISINLEMPCDVEADIADAYLKPTGVWR
jgi:hypothetical protein